MKNRKKYRILVDMDSVLNDFMTYLYVKMSHTGFNIIAPEKNRTWDLSTHFIGDKDKIKKAYQSLVTEKGFWENIPIHDKYTVEVFQYLNDNYDVWIATIPWYSIRERCIEEKIKWVEKALPFFDTNKMEFTEKKWLLEGDYIIDDKPETLQKCHKFGFGTIKMYKPWNIECKTDFTIRNWIELYNLF